MRIDLKRKQMTGRLLLAVMIAAGLATGCGSGSVKQSVQYDTAATNDIYMNASYAETASTTEMAPEAAAAEEVDTGEGSTGVAVQDTQRKLIRNVDLEVETEEFDQLLETVTQKTSQAGGYIEQSYTYNGSNYYGGGRRNANLTVRIPADQLNAFLSSVAEVSNVISRNESVADVTLQYVDMESHKKALQAEQDRLLELLEQAETIEDIISIESRLSEVRYQIESMESQLRTMDNQVSYSTVYLYINEVETYTPVAEQSIMEKISTGFMRSIHNIGNGLLDLVIWTIIKLPYLIIWAVVIAAAVLCVRGFIRRKKKKAAHRQTMQQPAAEIQNKGEKES